MSTETIPETHEWSPTGTIDTGHQPPRVLWRCTCNNQEWGMGDEAPARCEWDENPSPAAAQAATDVLAQAREAAHDAGAQWEWDTETAHEVADAALNVVISHTLGRVRTLIAHCDPDFYAVIDSLETELGALKERLDG